MYIAKSKTNTKIALLTVHYANSFGGILQAYASQRILSGYGDVCIIDYRPSNIRLLLSPIRFPDFKKTVKDVARLFPRYRLIRKFRQFISTHLNLIGPFETIEDLEHLENQFDVLVAGSDQIWNPEIMGYSNIPAFLLDFVKFKRKISYASSLGSYVYKAAEKKRLIRSLRTFKCLSVREKDTSMLLASWLQRPVAHLVDPTLMLQPLEWRSLVRGNPYEFPSGYVLVYALKLGNELKKTIEIVSRLIDKPVVIINQDPVLGVRCAKHVQDAGPLDFISLFLGATFVVTDSFHGTTFALNFNIPFITIKPLMGKNRIQSILNLMKLADRFVSNTDTVSNLVNLDIDFGYVNSNLTKLRAEAHDYLEAAFIL